MNNQIGQDDAEIIMLLSKDLRVAAETLGDKEARFLVDRYYQMQNNRIRCDGQTRSMSEEPHAIIEWVSQKSRTLEEQIKSALNRYAKSQTMGIWALSHVGIGPILASGLISNIDIRKSRTISCLWSFCGLNPSVKWNKGKKRPWSSSLKVICYKIGESFIKFQDHKDNQYGKLFQERRDKEWKKNLNGDNIIRCSQILKEKRFDKGSVAYKWLSGQVDVKWAEEKVKSGDGFGIDPKLADPACMNICVAMLPPAQIHARARRVAVKMFLSHYWAQAYRVEYGKEPPGPWVVDIAGHSGVIEHQPKLT